MTRRAAVALVSALAIGCSPRDARFAPIGFDASERAQLAKAAEAWCAATDGKWCPGLDDSSGAKIRLRSDDFGAAAQYAYGSIDVADYRESMGATWGFWLLLAVEHELGHVYGCGHDPRPLPNHTTMSSRYDQQMLNDGVVHLKENRSIWSCPNGP